MAKIIVSVLVLVSVFCTVGSTRHDSNLQSPTKYYIIAQCQTTLYPRLCIESLSTSMKSSDQSPHHVAQVALMVGLLKAQRTRDYVTQVAKEMKQNNADEYQAVRDCLGQISDSVDQLSQSLKELRRINRDGEGSFLWHSSNVKTWVSTAVTDAAMCMDGFAGHTMSGKVKATIKAKVLNVEQVCSNALALFNRFVARHRAATTTTKSKYYCLKCSP